MEILHYGCFRIFLLYNDSYVLDISNEYDEVIDSINYIQLTNLTQWHEINVLT